MTTPPGGHALVYDMLMWPVERAVLSAWRRRLGRRAGGRVLEIGAGTGSQLGWYGPGAVVTALEPSLAMAARSRPRAAAARVPVVLVQGAAEALPFPAASFDTVVFSFAFCSVADPALVLAEARRVLIPGGRLLMLEHVHVLWQPGRWLQRLAAPAWAAAAGGCRLDRDTVGLVRAAGFEVLDVRAHALRWVVELLARTPCAPTPDVG
ncbi:MAG: class I SAM-dependent methyltransferase [Thermoleophilia bacterium]